MQPHPQREDGATPTAEEAGRPASPALPEPGPAPVGPALRVPDPAPVPGRPDPGQAPVGPAADPRKGIG